MLRFKDCQSKVVQVGSPGSISGMDEHVKAVKSQALVEQQQQPMCSCYSGQSHKMLWSQGNAFEHPEYR